MVYLSFPWKVEPKNTLLFSNKIENMGIFEVWLSISQACYNNTSTATLILKFIDETNQTHILHKEPKEFE